MSVKDFQTYPVHILEEKNDINVNSYAAWIFLAASNLLHYINDPHYSEVNAIRSMMQKTKQSTVHVEFRLEYFPQILLS